MDTLRILHVVTHMTLDGLETMIMNYYRKIDRDKIQFDFLVHRNEEAYYDKEIESLGGNIFHLPRLNPFSKSYKNALKNFLLNHPEYKIIHVHQDCLSGVILKVAKECGVPIRIAHSHSSSQDKNLKYLIKLYFKRIIPKYSTHLLSCGKKAGEWMFSGAKFDVLNNAIEAEKFTFSQDKRSQMRTALHIPNNKLVIGHVGRFSEAKNHSFLIKIFTEILKTTDALLLLVGDGELRPNIESQAKHLGIYDKILFLGRRSNVCDILQAMDLFVFPSIYEGLPVSIIEAQASGIPCLISDAVPIECKITDLVSQITLNNSAESWAEVVLKQQFVNRDNMAQTIKECGYDINTNAKQLSDFYLSF